MDRFFLPVTAKGRWFKWLAICLFTIVSALLLLSQASEIRAYEKACADPVLVDAVISVEQTGFFIESWESYLSYEYEGKQYSHVYFKGNQNSRQMESDGDRITIAIDPANPGRLVRSMVRPNLLVIALALASFAPTLIAYAAAVENPGFYQWRTGRNKNQRHASSPDYPKDLFVLYLPVFTVSVTLFAILFPYTFRRII